MKELKAPIGKGNNPSAAAEIQLGPCAFGVARILWLFLIKKRMCPAHAIRGWLSSGGLFYFLSAREINQPHSLHPLPASPTSLLVGAHEHWDDVHLGLLGPLGKGRRGLGWALLGALSFLLSLHRLL